MNYYHCFDGFMIEPTKGMTLREFVEWDAWKRARKLQEEIENLPIEKRFLSSPDYKLAMAMPVNVAITISNHSVEKCGTNAPPIVADRLGGKMVCDDSYSFFGTFGEFLVHISASQYPWIGELEYPQWEINEPDLISYDNYDYQLNGMEVEE